LSFHYIIVHPECKEKAYLSEQIPTNTLNMLLYNYYMLSNM